MALERKSAEEGIDLSAKQVVFIEKLNSAFKDRHGESAGPGELLSQDTCYVGRLKGVERVYLHTMIDTYGSVAFGFVHTTRQPEAAVAVVHYDVLPFYEAHGLLVKAILTNNGRAYYGTVAHPYERYLELNDIEHFRTKVCSPQTNGFVERFNRTVLDEFFRVVFWQKF